MFSTGGEGDCIHNKPGTERIQAFADILHSALCCHSDETHTPIANPPNSAQLEGTPHHSLTYIQVCAVVWECGEGQTDRHRRPWPIYILPRLRLTWNVINHSPRSNWKAGDTVLQKQFRSLMITICIHFNGCFSLWLWSNPFPHGFLLREQNLWQEVAEVFLMAGCSSCHPTNSVKALKATSAFGLGRRR